MKLSRKDLILKYIVEDYVRTCEPVGSHTLLLNHHLKLSSATIRNVMAQLEKEEMLEKTHTSSGRVPSLKGYKYYVAKLRDEKVDNTIRYEMDKLFDSSKSIDEVLNESCQVLSNLTKLATCFLSPSVYDEKIVKIEVIPLTEETFSMILVTDKGFVENKTFIKNSKIKMDELIKLTEVISKELYGIKLVDILERIEDLRPIDNKDYKYEYLFKTLLSTLKDFFKKRGNRFYGKDYLLEQPEFKNNIEETKKLFDLFLNSNRLAQFFSSCGDEISISIGNGVYKDITIITKDVKIPNTDLELGRIAVVGPTRMDYDKVLVYLDYTVMMITNHLNDLREVNIDER